MQTVTADDILAEFRQMVKDSDSRTVAERLSITPQYVRYVVSGERELSEELALKLGYRRNETTYTKIEGA